MLQTPLQIAPCGSHATLVNKVQKSGQIVKNGSYGFVILEGRADGHTRRRFVFVTNPFIISRSMLMTAIAVLTSILNCMTPSNVLSLVTDFTQCQ